MNAKTRKTKGYGKREFEVKMFDGKGCHDQIREDQPSR